MLDIIQKNKPWTEKYHSDEILGIIKANSQQQILINSQEYWYN